MDDCKNCESIVKRVLSKCIQEKSQQSLTVPVADWLDRATHYTGISKENLNQVLQQRLNKDKDDKKEQKFSINEKIKISNVLKECYSQAGSFGYSFVYMLLKLNCDSQDFQEIMNNSGYYSVEADGDRNILVEDPKLRFERYHYLEKLLISRQSMKPIYYIEEIKLQLVRSTLLICKPDNLDTVPQSDCYKCDPIMFYACSKEGCTSSLFCFQKEQAKKDFNKWIIHTLIPSLKPSSVVVIDKNCIHRRTVESHITRNHSKEQMIKWLKEHSIPCEVGMHKADLYKLIEKCSFKDTDNKIDQIFKSYGHEVVHLPCQLHELSMSRVMLKHLKELLPAISSSVSSFRGKKINEYVLLKAKLSEVIANLNFDDIHKEILQHEESLHSCDLMLEDILDFNYRLNNKENSFIDSCSSCYGNEVLVKIDNLSLGQ